jgi:predicted GH43/DUF377 family glycosyl hydrolase
VTPPPERSRSLVDDAGVDLRPDPDRTILRPFVPGHEDVGPGDSRAGPVIERILALSEHDVVDALRRVEAGLASRHADPGRTFDDHAAMVSHRLDESGPLSAARLRLLGAAFTHEYSIEGAALCNPSIVRHPVQPGGGDTAVVIAVRGIGEGHRSSIGFRTARIGANGTVSVDVPGPDARTGVARPAAHDRAVLHRKLADLGDDHENAAYVLDHLPERFDGDQLAAGIEALEADASTRRHTSSTIANLRRLARCSYTVEFSESTALSERVLWPRSPIEHQGMEDARLVEITDASAPRYCATYTAFDGALISQNLLTTDDFVTFDVSPMAGAAARGKGLALFPRRVNGRFAAMSRSDRESNSIAYSDDLRCWDASQSIQTPHAAWEVVQIGNCGSPIETAEGWLVLTHGVGPLRTYSIGAILLDLDEPHRIAAATREPIIRPPRHGGYVPNVVYSCGAVVVGERLILPYGIGDQRIAVATIGLSDLLAAMRRTP